MWLILSRCCLSFVSLGSVLVVRRCGRLCGRSRDRQLVIERELAQFIRSIMQFVYPVQSFPAGFEVSAC